MTKEIKSFLLDIHHPCLLCIQRETKPIKNLVDEKRDDQKIQVENGVAKAIGSYPNVFVVQNDKIQIAREVPGSNNAEKTINTAMLYILGNELNGITAPVQFKAIRAVCKSHACLDDANFASTMKDEKDFFICDGAGKGQTAALTLPGRKKAQALATQLNAE